MYNAILFCDYTDNIFTNNFLGPYKVAHTIRKAGYTCLVINHLSAWTLTELQELIDLTVSDETRLVGFSTTFMRSIEIDRDPTKPTPPLPDLPHDTVFPQGKEFENKFMAYLKNKNKNVKTAVGGVRASPEYSNRNINFVSLGFSENTVVNLMNHLFKDEPLVNSSKNIWGRFILDDKFAKGYNFQEGEMRWLPIDVVNHKYLPIEIGRGCVFKCKFCDYPMTGKKIFDFVKYEEVIRAELQDTYDKFGIKHFIIVDDTFNDHIQKLERILEAVKKLTFKPQFWTTLRLDLLHTRPETIHILYEMGVRTMFFGIESFNPPSAKAIGKGFNREKQISTIQYIDKTYPDVSMHGSFIVGLPYESIESCDTTCKMLNSGEIPLASWNFYSLMLFNPKHFNFNSELSMHFDQYGYEDMGTPEESLTINWKNEHMTYEKSKELVLGYLNTSRENSRHKLTGMASYQMYDYGYDFDTALKTAWKDVDWHHLETVDRPAFIAEYKHMLKELISASC